MNGRAPNAIIDHKTDKIIVQQPLPPFNCLALEGGGVRGAAYAGLFKVLSRFGLTKDIKHVAGSSAGAIASLLVALGYSEEEIAKELYELPIEAFVEKSGHWLMKPTLWSQARMTLHILRSKEISLSSGLVMQKWLEERVERKLGKKDATFADLKARVESLDNQTAKDAFKYFYVVATNISLKVPESEVFSHIKTPHVSIATAVRASGTFPYIFSPVDINGSKYVDGGCKYNLRCNIFDAKEFLPDGYTFNEKGMNPGVFAVKIDSREEIDQVIWGVRKYNKLETVSEYTGAVAYACTDNIDANEMRTSRTVLALPDQAIGSLNFKIGTDGRLNLCSTAEDVTQEFLENMIGAAYKVAAYNSVTDWLDTLTLDDLHHVIARYRAMLPNAPLASNANAAADDHPLKLDPANPTRQDIGKYIAYIDKYAKYRISKFQNSKIKFKPNSEPRHINLNPASNTNKWEEILKSNMLYRIDAMRRNIKETDDRIKNILSDFLDGDESVIVQHLHGDYFDTVKLLAGYMEYRDILTDEVAELEMKLGTCKDRYPKDIFNKNYHLLATKVAELANEKNISTALKAVIDNIDILNPVITHNSLQADDNVIFSYYLRNIPDCKIFMIAMILYLEHRKAKELSVFEKLYGEIFPGEKCPRNMDELAYTFPGIEKSSLLVHAYRIEELLLFFARKENPHSVPDINLDKVFGAYKPFLKSTLPKAKGSTSGNNEDLSAAIPLHTIFRVKPHSPGTDPSRQYRTEHKPG